MTRRLVVSARAEADLREIWLYSYRNWGEAIADRYLDELATGLVACGSEPERGRSREEVRPRYWSRLLGRHIAFHSVTEAEVRIQRVLHASMDPGLHLEDDL